MQRYHQIFQQVIGAEGVEIEMKDKRYVSNFKSTL